MLHVGAVLIVQGVFQYHLVTSETCNKKNAKLIYICFHQYWYYEHADHNHARWRHCDICDSISTIEKCRLRSSILILMPAFFYVFTQTLTNLHAIVWKTLFNACWLRGPNLRTVGALSRTPHFLGALLQVGREPPLAT